MECLDGRFFSTFKHADVVELAESGDLCTVGREADDRSQRESQRDL